MVLKLLDYIEIKTKITSIFAFLMTIAYLFYLGKPINWGLTVIFFISMFVFDLTTTAINNYIDTKTNHQALQFKRKSALLIIYVLFAISAGFGLYLAYLTDIVVFLLGAICFLCGVFYTFGPIPISRQPLGELFSGVFYGLLIPFILLYINQPQGTYLSLKLSLSTISLDLNVMPLLIVIFLSIIPTCTTANIMLANNICDVDKDIAVMRYTLPYYLGNRASLYLFAALYYIPYGAIVLMVAFRMLSPICLISLLTLVLVQKNINIFFKLQDKRKTFICSIKNYVIIMAGITFLIFISGLIG
ncbi:MAG: 1,4-dihydroxy-2-naphthoate octaprenyltransferase [Eubacterium sp.]|nr:1,4-dihydroxy-2-naphthoate octaprenyltransferase [Eubacterium sp.]